MNKMVKPSTTDLAADFRRVMDNTDNIRNVSVIGGYHHGKTTLVNTLVADACDPQNMRMKQSCRSTGISLRYKLTDEDLNSFKGTRAGNDYLLNLVDSPGHTDFSAEVSAALRITDGAMVVVDCVETLVRLAHAEGVHPVLILNKMDRCISQFKLDGEAAYKLFTEVIEEANKISDVVFSPVNGNVAFSDGCNGWAFTLRHFAKWYCSKFAGVDESVIMNRLWGDNFYDPKTEEWIKERTTTDSCIRGFVHFCYDPIKKIIEDCLSENKGHVWDSLKVHGVTMKKEDKKLVEEGEPFMKHVMQTWLPAAKALLEMMIIDVPSPRTAQKDRAEKLCKGRPNETQAKAISECDPNGKVMIYVSKLIPDDLDKGIFYAFGRVFSGTVSAEKNVRSMGPKFTGGVRDLYMDKVKETFIWMADTQLPVEEVPCGNIVAMTFLNEFIAPSSTLTDVEEVDAHPLRAMKFSYLPVVRVAVQPKVPSDHPKLVKGLERLCRSDPMVDWTTEGNGRHILGFAGQLQLDICMKDLREDFMDGAELEILEKSVMCRETIGRTSRNPAVRETVDCSLKIIAHPMEEKDVAAVEKWLVDDDKHGHVPCFESIKDKILYFNPETTGPNVVIRDSDQDYPSKIEKSVCDAFEYTLKNGVMAGEIMRGIRFEVGVDCIEHDDVYGFCVDKTVEVTEKAIKESVREAKPQLLEPVYQVEVVSPEISVVEKILDVLKQKGAEVLYNGQRHGTLYHIKARITVAKSFGLYYDLFTSDEAFPQFMFDGWEKMPSDSKNDEKEWKKRRATIRKMKGLD